MLVIHGLIRFNIGTSSSRRLRKINNKIPSVVYGKNQKTIYFSLDHDIIFNMQKKPQFYTDSMILKIDSDKYLVCVKEVQKHCFKPKLLHIDFLYQ